MLRLRPNVGAFQSPWSIEECQESFIVKDANGRPGKSVPRYSPASKFGQPGRLTRDEAFLIALNIAKLPSVPRQILKDIPRPPNSASRDD